MTEREVLDVAASLEKKWDARVGFFARRLDDGREIAYRADEALKPWSSMKILTLFELFRQAEQGRRDLNELHTCTTPQAPVGGTGVLHHLRPPVTMPLYDFAMLSIIVSDNNAYFFLRDLIGLARLFDVLDELGMKNSGDRTADPKTGYPLLSRSTPRDMATLMENIARPIRVSQKTCDEMIGILYRQMQFWTLPRHIEGFKTHGYGLNPRSAAWVAHKTGESGGQRSDVGLVHTPFAEWVISVMVDRKPRFETWPDADGGYLSIQEISGAVYQLFKFEAGAI